MDEAGQPGAATPGEHDDRAGRFDDPARSSGGWAPRGDGWSSPADERTPPPWAPPEQAAGWASGSVRHGDLPAPLPGNTPAESTQQANGRPLNGYRRWDRYPTDPGMPISAPPGAGSPLDPPTADRLMVPAQRPAPTGEQTRLRLVPPAGDPEPARHLTDESAAHVGEESARRQSDEFARSGPEESPRHTADAASRYGDAVPPRQTTDGPGRYGIEESARHAQDEPARNVPEPPVAGPADEPGGWRETTRPASAPPVAQASSVAPAGSGAPQPPAGRGADRRAESGGSAPDQERPRWADAFGSAINRPEEPPGRSGGTHTRHDAESSRPQQSGWAPPWATTESPQPTGRRARSEWSPDWYPRPFPTGDPGSEPEQPYPGAGVAADPAYPTWAPTPAAGPPAASGEPARPPVPPDRTGPPYREPGTHLGGTRSAEYTGRRSAPDSTESTRAAATPEPAVLPQRVPSEPDVPVVPDLPTPEPPAETPELARIATHLRREDEPPPLRDRPEGFDVKAILGAVRGVAGVRDASLRTTPAGAHSLRLDLADGADPAEVSRHVARLLQERMGLAAAPQNLPGEAAPAPIATPTAGSTPIPPPMTAPAPAPIAASAPTPPPNTAPAPPPITAPAPAPTAASAPAVAPAPRRAARELTDPSAEVPRRRRRQISTHSGRASVVEQPRPFPGGTEPGPTVVGGATGSPVAAGTSYSGAQLTTTESAPSRPINPDGPPGPRVVIDHVQVSTFGLDATVEVRLLAGPEAAAGLATGPAVDGYVLRLCAVAAASAVDELLRGAERTAGTGRCFVEHAAVVPFGSCEVATVVVFLVCDGWVEQLAGSALVSGDPRQAVVRATLAAVNRRLEALLA